MGKKMIYIPGKGVQLILTGFRLVDKEHNVWQCKCCGYLARFEADGPFENGWKNCPSCGEPVYEAGDKQ